MCKDLAGPAFQPISACLQSGFSQFSTLLSVNLWFFKLVRQIHVQWNVYDWFLVFLPWISSDPAMQCDWQVNWFFHSFLFFQVFLIFPIIRSPLCFTELDMENACDLNSRKPEWASLGAGNCDSNSVPFLLHLVVAVFLAVQEGWSPKAHPSPATLLLYGAHEEKFRVPDNRIPTTYSSTLLSSICLSEPPQISRSTS